MKDFDFNTHKCQKCKHSTFRYGVGGVPLKPTCGLLEYHHSECAEFDKYIVSLYNSRSKRMVEVMREMELSKIEHAKLVSYTETLERKVKELETERSAKNE